MVLQGVDTSVFNPLPVPRIIHSNIVILSGGKLEIRKGQDIVIQAFKKLLLVCPDALLVACWCNDSPSISSISMSPYVSSAPTNGDAESIGKGWQQGIPRKNIVVPGILNSAQMLLCLNRLILLFSLIVVRVAPTLLRWKLSHVAFQRCCLLIQAILI